MMRSGKKHRAARCRYWSGHRKLMQKSKNANKRQTSVISNFLIMLLFVLSHCSTYATGGSVAVYREAMIVQKLCRENWAGQTICICAHFQKLNSSCKNEVRMGSLTTHADPTCHFRASCTSVYLGAAAISALSISNSSSNSHLCSSVRLFPFFAAFSVFWMSAIFFFISF